MMVFVVAFVTALVVMGVLDALWFSVAIKRIYRPAIGHLMAETPNIGAAVVFYVGYALGLTYLIVVPALHAGLLEQAIVRGGVLGFIAYGTYDFTSLAILRGWPVKMTVIDLVWGVVITAVTAAASFLIAAMLG